MGQMLPHILQDQKVYFGGVGREGIPHLRMAGCSWKAAVSL